MKQGLEDHARLNEPTTDPEWTVPSPSRRRKGRPWLFAVLGAVVALVVAGGAATGIELASSGNGARPSTVHTTTPPPSPPTPTLSDPAVRAVLDEYSAAYSAESLSRLDAIFAPDLQRQNGNEPVQGRAEALATYAQQFNELQNPYYSLSDMSVVVAPDKATATGHYTVTSSSGTSSNDVIFELAARNGAVLLTRITVPPAPPAPTTTPPSSSAPDNGGAGSEPTSPGPEQTTPGPEQTPAAPEPSTPDGGGGDEGDSGGSWPRGPGGGWYGPELPPPDVPNLW